LKFVQTSAFVRTVITRPRANPRSQQRTPVRMMIPLLPPRFSGQCSSPTCLAMSRSFSNQYGEYALLYIGATPHKGFE
jgi:hypothetical protein